LEGYKNVAENASNGFYFDLGQMPVESEAARVFLSLHVDRESWKRHLFTRGARGFRGRASGASTQKSDAIFCIDENSGGGGLKRVARAGRPEIRGSKALFPADEGPGRPPSVGCRTKRSEHH
jgi:hypothetical protein